MRDQTGYEAATRMVEEFRARLPRGFQVEVVIPMMWERVHLYALTDAEWQKVMSVDWVGEYRNFFRRIGQDNRPAAWERSGGHALPMPATDLAEINQRLGHVGSPYRLVPYFGETKYDAVWADLYWLQDTRKY